MKRAHAAGLRILAADVKGDDLLEARAEGVLAEPTGWLFGNEARGLEDEALDLADRVLKLPIFGRAESLIWRRPPASACMKAHSLSGRRPSTEVTDAGGSGKRSR